MVVVSAELYCVHSTVEYIRTNLQNHPEKACYIMKYYSGKKKKKNLPI